MMSLRSLATLLATALVVPSLTACDFDGAYDLPLPGNPVDADDALTVTASFADVLNVVPRSPVMVDDVVVGQVSEVERDGWTAEVTLQVPKDVEVSDDVTAEIRQTSLLGEKYVALVEPGGRRVGRLEEGDHIPLASTGRNPEVEEVLGALSFLLSGGGVGQIRTISTELNKVMSGRTGRIRHLMRGLDDLVGTLDEQKHDIIAAMESINSLADTLVREKKTIQDALDATGPALAVLNRQHRQLVTMLGQLDELGRVGTRVIGATKEDLLATLGHLQPILQRLNETGES
ncbi:MAG TPA: MCE family protein, partial [Nocardioides sp.]